MEQMQKEAFSKTHKLEAFEKELLEKNLPAKLIAVDEISGLVSLEDTILV